MNRGFGISDRKRPGPKPQGLIKVLWMAFYKINSMFASTVSIKYRL